MPRTTEQEVAAQLLAKMASLHSASESILGDVQRVISNIDHWENAVAELQAQLPTLPTELQQPVADLLATSVIANIVTNMGTAKTALEAYRDAHQPS